MKVYISMLSCWLLFFAFGCEPATKSENSVETKIDQVLSSDKKSVSVLDSFPVQKKDAAPSFSTKYYRNLSESFNFKLNLYDLINDIQTDLQLQIFSKNDSLIQIIKIRIGTSYPLVQYSQVRSFETHFNEKKEIPEEYHGELVVGDFNFDSLTDIALINNIPVSGTPSYNFYLQSKEGEFKENRYFTNEVRYIPCKQDSLKRKFSTRSHSGCCAGVFRYYQIDSTGKWRMTYEIEKDARDE